MFFLRKDDPTNWHYQIHGCCNNCDILYTPGLVWLLLKFLIVWSIFAGCGYYRPQRSYEGYVFTRVCHSVQRGVYSRGLLWEGSALGGVPAPGGVWRPPLARSRRLLSQTVRILLECILVYYYLLAVKFWWPDHPAGTSKDSDKCDSIKRFWFSVLMVVYEKFSFSNIQRIWVKICGKYIYRKM